MCCFFYISVLVLKHVRGIKACPLKWVQSMMAVIQKQSISKQDTAATVTYPLRASTIPFTDDPPLLFSGISLLLFSTLSPIVCLSLSNQAEHTICHSILCLNIHTISETWLIWRGMLSDLGCWTNTTSIRECTAVSIHCEYTEVRLTVSVLQSVYSLSGKDVTVSPAQATLQSQQWLIVFICCNSQQEHKVGRKERLAWNFTERRCSCKWNTCESPQQWIWYFN